MHFKMKNIFIYNLDHDFALGDNSSNFTPQKSILRMRNLYTCFPALYANEGDYILYLDSETNNIINKDTDFQKGTSIFYPLIQAKHLSIITLSELKHLNIENINIRPWGWDRSLISKLYKSDIDYSKLPAYNIIDQLREASSRENSIRVYTELIATLKNPSNNPYYHLFQEFDGIIGTSNCNEVIDFYKKNKNIYVKSPWSSSGRGLIYTDELNETQVAQWCQGIIRKQGSVIIEKAYQRAIDFSSEWVLRNGDIEFIGFGIFKVSSRGKYKANIVGESSRLKSTIISKICDLTNLEFSQVASVLDFVITQQRTALLRHYKHISISGLEQPLGIDMFATTSGSIHPCVEVNLRNTMGHVALEVNRQIKCIKDIRILKELTKFVTGDELSLPEIN